ncbi:MAG: NADH-quinone oxidoreductase subunit NuoF [Desulfobacteraceae bacterium]|nr:NADH-quinone oxidoreductase subunit NuoF [Desulfobacteraceae bacterium]
MIVKEHRISLKNVGRIDPEAIGDYLREGGYEGLKRVLGMPPEIIIDELTEANLRGRGGAGFPTGVKERFTSEAYCRHCGPKYIVCNADEGEPGTFKDRIIMENDPHILIEGMIIAAYAVGATSGYIYIRGEYCKSISRIEKALEAAREKGYLGTNIGGSGFDLDLKIRLGAGSYLCGEELTLLESLEGKRGYPRIKPPFPAEHGLWGVPTLINNVETFSQIPFIMTHGAKQYLQLGTPDSPGTKIFTISGDVKRPGYYETKMDVTLGQLINGLAGGMTPGSTFKAALLGGAAGTFVDASALETPMSFDALKKMDAVLGSGAVIVMGHHRSLVDMTRSILDFFKHESCGKCVPCRVGTTILAKMMDEKVSNSSENTALLDRMCAEARYMADSSLCPLGQSPILPLDSLKRTFNQQFQAELKN